MEPDLDRRIVSHVTESFKQLSDRWDARQSLQSTAIRLACANVSADDCDRLRQIADQRAQAAADGDPILTARKDREFHSYLIHLAANSVIDDLMHSDGLLDLTASCDNPQAVLDLHRQIIDALERRDADQAESQLAVLLQDAKKQSLDLRDENPHT